MNKPVSTVSRRSFLTVYALLASTMMLCAAHANAQDRGSITGTVRDSADIPLFGVEVASDSASVRALTDDHGVFRLAGVPLGLRRLTARRLGFAPSQVIVQVSPNDEATVEIHLTAIVATLAPVVIHPSRMTYTGRLAGYYERLEKRTGGYFITREQIDRENPRMLGQLLQHVPGVTGVRLRGRTGGIRLRGRTCWPLVWIDGTPMPSGEVDLDSFSPTSIHGIELYLGSTTAPARYTYTRDVSSCGTILLWSRGPDTDPITVIPTPSVDLERLLSNLSIFSAAQVDRKAVLDSTRLLELSFPPSLFAAGVSGLVIAEFVVDTAGRVEEGSVGIVSSTARLFTESVRIALESATYLPAIRNGHPVRQLVQQPFEFSADRQGRAR